MAGDERRTALRYVHTLFESGSLSGLSDGQLLRRFNDRREGVSEAAFALLVEEHGPMVLRVCRSILADSHAAEDAFQATFLILAQKANALQVRDTVGPWLYQVAFRVASCARSTAFRHRRLEARAAELKTVAIEEETADDIAPIVHAELDALPERYRAVVVLCCLEGRTHAEAARQLGCPVGTVQSRLARGRERLRDRLVRRGIAPAAILLGTASAEAALPEVLLNSTTELALMFVAGGMSSTGAISGGLKLLYRKVSGDMLMNKVKSSLFAIVGISAVVVCAFAFQTRGVAKAPEPVAQVEEKKGVVRMIPPQLNFGPLRVGSFAEAGVNMIFDDKEDGKDLAVKVIPPPSFKVRTLRVRARTQQNKKVQLVEFGLAIDTTQRGEISDKVRVELGDQKVDLPVTATILPADPSLTKVLVIESGFGSASADSNYYRPWFDLVKSENLDVSYLDPSNEGLHNADSEGMGDDDLPLVPAWLKQFDVILLAETGPVFIKGFQGTVLQSYVRRGGRLIINASSFMMDSIPNANFILKRFGLEVEDRDVTKGPRKSAVNQAPSGWIQFTAKGKPGENDPLMKGIQSVTFQRVSPVRLLPGSNARLLLFDSDDPQQAYAAVARDVGEVVVLGPPLLFSWIGKDESTDGDNVLFMRNLLKKPQSR